MDVRAEMVVFFQELEGLDQRFCARPKTYSLGCFVVLDTLLKKWGCLTPNSREEVDMLQVHLASISGEDTVAFSHYTGPLT